MKNIEDKIRKLFSESNKTSMNIQHYFNKPNVREELESITSINLNIHFLKEIDKSFSKIDEQISKIESKSHLFTTYDEQHGFAELKDHVNHIKYERFKSLIKKFTGETI
ncbi:Uncharacterised protein [Vibrio cholerae]|nr:Uncharacterised protein [Vibrio cholerae]